jgi:adenylyltransferase/sulfurtransferase
VNPLEITAQEAKSLLDSQTPPRLVDVREADEFAICKIPGAELLALSAFAENYAGRLPDKPQKILLYCHHGMRSLRAAEFLSGRGYTDAKSIAGGIDAWSREIDPAVPRY